jgi:hypothetical protein
MSQSSRVMRDKRKALETIIVKLGKLLPHLGNENDGEALGAVRAITALLKRAGLDWHDLVALLHGNQPFSVPCSTSSPMG